MTIGTLKMPRMGETMEEGKLVAWLVEPGVAFKRGQEIVEVETDKTIVEFPALGDGVIVETLVELGEVISVGTPIAKIDLGDAPDWTDADGGGNEGEPAQGEANPVRETAEESSTTSAVGSGNLRRATPVARRIARQKGIDLNTLTGSGRRGRIERDDVAAATTPTDETRQIAGVTCLQKGSKAAVPVVFLHGFGADHAVWGGLQSRLSSVGRYTLSLDLPGHGTTVHEAKSTADLHAPVDQVMRELGLGATHIVGHSMGAIVATKLAIMEGVKSLTLIAPAGLGHSIDASFLYGLAHAESSGEVAHLLERITDGPHGLSSAKIAEIYGIMAKRRLTDLADALVGSTGQAISIRSDLVELAERIPVHVILGHRDQIIDWRETLDISPKIATHHLPQAGHSPHWEALGTVAAIITDITR